MNLNDKITSLAKTFGAADIGFSDVEGLNDYGYKYAVSIFVRLLDGVVDEITDKPTYEYYSHYKSVNTLINDLTLRVATLIEDSGYKALTVSSSQSVGEREEYRGMFPHKTAATRSGRGYIGKSGLFVHDDFGPRLRIGTVLTNAPLIVGIPKTESECGECNLCVRNCSASAQTGKNWYAGMERNDLYDPRACSEFMKNYFSHIGNGFVCGICMQVCPKGKKNKRL
ncbi:MAG: epoxyqueuosine reductase [Eubacteriaceae bacterium]|nr:epoxyqueuosine reductase [Eubacteriaceae bacterium]